MQYRHIQLLAVCIFMLYALVGFVENYHTHQERYPVFSWSLFSEIPNGGKEYSLLITQVGNRHFSPPVPFEEAGQVFDSRVGSLPQYTYPIRKLGAAIESADTEQIAQHRRDLELIFNGDSFTYTVISFEYNPVDWYVHGVRTNLKEIATFSSPL